MLPEIPDEQREVTKVDKYGGSREIDYKAMTTNKLTRLVAALAGKARTQEIDIALMKARIKEIEEILRRVKLV